MKKMYEAGFSIGEEVGWVHFEPLSSALSASNSDLIVGIFVREWVRRSRLVHSKSVQQKSRRVAKNRIAILKKILKELLETSKNL